MKENKRYYKINCLFCGVDYEAAKKRTKFCSRSCGSKWHHRNNENFKHTLKNLTAKQNIKKVSVICQFCNKQYKVIPSRLKKTKFCSKTCKSSFIYEQNKDIMIERARKVCTGRPSPTKGRSHTKEAIEKIIKASSERPCGFGGVKYRPYIDKFGRLLKLKSSYEIIFVMDFLEKNDWFWEYEPKCFKLKSGKYYIPDFYVKDIDQWFEIKGWLRHKSVEKYKTFICEYPEINIALLHPSGIENYGDFSYRNTKKIREEWRIN